MKLLYTGLDPSRFYFSGEVDHVPFIAIQPRAIEDIMPYLVQAKEDVILTSRTAVQCFVQGMQLCQQNYRNKRYFVVGAATAQLLEQSGAHDILVAKQQDAEGVCLLLSAYPSSFIFYPHAAGARDVIARYLKAQEIPHLACWLYTTEALQPNPLPNLEKYTHVMFTSPSTVKAFFQCYPRLPNHLVCQAIGPVTRHALLKVLEDTKQVDQILG